VSVSFLNSAIPNSASIPELIVRIKTVIRLSVGREHPLLGGRHPCAERRLPSYNCPEWRMGLRGIFEPDLTEDTHQESIDFCLSSIYAVHLTMYAVSS
jgi:hypothetical protein